MHPHHTTMVLNNDHTCCLILATLMITALVPSFCLYVPVSSEHHGLHCKKNEVSSHWSMHDLSSKRHTLGSRTKKHWFNRVKIPGVTTWQTDQTPIWVTYLAHMLKDEPGNMCSCWVPCHSNVSVTSLPTWINNVSMDPGWCGKNNVMSFMALPIMQWSIVCIMLHSMGAMLYAE